MSKGVKYDNDKPRWGLLPFKEVEQVVDVLTFGSKKYSDDNWKKVENAQERYFDAMLRHITEYRYNEKLDDETGKSHLAHAICCALFMMWFDNLPKTTVTNGTVFVEGDSGISFNLKPTDLENYYFVTEDVMLNRISDRIKSCGSLLSNMVDVKEMVDKNGDYYEYIGKNSNHFKFKDGGMGNLGFYDGVPDAHTHKIEDGFINKDKPLLNDSPTHLTPENLMDMLKPLKGDNRLIGNGEGVSLEPVSDDSCTTSKIGVGIASLSTEPKAKPKKCCYSNMGNAQIIDKCTPSEILRCLQDIYDANDKSGNAWFNMDSMKTLSGQNEYVYYGESCTETFFFELFHNKFMRIYN